MTSTRAAAPPPAHVLAAFGAVERPVAVPGGRGTTWSSGPIILKPLDSPPGAMEWMDAVLPTLRSPDLRLPLPLRSHDGRLIVDGWTATPLLVGEHPVGRWHERAAVARRFAEVLVGLPQPAFTVDRTDVWARADRIAWGENSLDDEEASPVPPSARRVVDALVAIRLPVDERNTIVHGDVTGNVLVAHGHPPALIDLTPYWRPVEYSVAIVAVDATSFEGAPTTLLDSIDPSPLFAQFVLRALLFRVVTDLLHGGGYDPRYDPAVQHTVARVGRGRR